MRAAILAALLAMPAAAQQKVECVNAPGEAFIMSVSTAAGSAGSSTTPSYVHAASTFPVSVVGTIQTNVAGSTINVQNVAGSSLAVYMMALPPGAATESTLAARFSAGQFIGGIASSIAVSGISGTTLAVQAISTAAVFVVNLPPGAASEATLSSRFAAGQFVGGVASSVAVRAENLDIRSLTFSRDKVDVTGSTLTVSVAIPPVLGVSPQPQSTWTVVGLVGVSLQPGTTMSATVQPLAGSTFTVDMIHNDGLALDTTVASGFSAAFKAGQNIGNNAFLAVASGTYAVSPQPQSTWSVTGIVSVSPQPSSTWTVMAGQTLPVDVVPNDGLALDTTVASGLAPLFRQGQSIGNSTFSVTFPSTQSVFALSMSSYGVQASSLDVRGLQAARDSVLAILASSVPVIQGAGPFVGVYATTQPTFAHQPSSYAVNASSLDIRALQFSRDSIQPVFVSSVPIRQRATVSTANSTSSTLAAAGQFTGTFEDVLDYSDISVTARPSVQSSTDGLVIEWSSDGVNVDADDVFTLYPSSTTQFTFGVTTRYFRVRYTNGPTAQTYFRLQTIFHPFNKKPSTHRISDHMSGENDVEAVKAVVFGKDVTNGVYSNVQIVGGRLLVDPTGLGEESSFYSFDSGLVSAVLASTDNAIMLITNPSTSTVRLKLFSRFMGTDINNVSVGYRLYSNAVITSSGTAKSITTIRSQTGVLSQARAFTSPTIAGYGSLIDSILQGQNTSSAQIQDGQAIWLDPGANWLITANPSSNNRTVDISVKWVEEP